MAGPGCVPRRIGNGRAMRAASRPPATPVVDPHAMRRKSGRPEKSRTQAAPAYPMQERGRPLADQSLPPSRQIEGSPRSGGTEAKSGAIAAASKRFPAGSGEIRAGCAARGAGARAPGRTAPCGRYARLVSKLPSCRQPEQGPGRALLSTCACKKGGRPRHNFAIQRRLGQTSMRQLCGQVTFAKRNQSRRRAGDCALQIANRLESSPDAARASPATIERSGGSSGIRHACSAW